MKFCSVCRLNHAEDARCIERGSDDSQPSRGDAHLIAGYLISEPVSLRQSVESFKATDTTSDRPCVITLANVDSDKFLNDAKTAAGLFHPAIADIYDTGRLDDGRCFVVSEHIEGRTLREVLDNVGSPGLLPSIEIVRQSAEALHALHTAGLKHGAVSPKNIVISKDSERTVVRMQHLDFGGIEQRAIVSNRIAIDNEIESLRYFAPEQFESGDANASSDIYSLGVVFYEMLAEHPPFDAPTAVGLIHKHRNETPPDLRIADYNLRMLVTHALTEALQKHARLRQSSANVLARQLRHIEQLATHSSTPPPAVVVEKFAKPKPILVSEPVKPERPSEPEVIRFSKPVVAPVVEEIPTVDPIPHEPVTPIAAPAAEPVAEIKPIFVAPRSRLKTWKKKLRSIADRMTPENTVASILSADKPNAADASTPKTPRKIEWQTPDDDIPSLAAVRAEQEQSGDTAPIPKAVVEVPKQVVEVPKVATKRSKTADIPFVEKLPEKPVVIDDPSKPMPVDVAPRKEPVPKAPVAKIPTPKVPVIQRPERRPAAVAAASADAVRTMSEKPQRKRSGLGFKVNLADLEEITLVRPPSNRVKIDWARATPRPDLTRVIPKQMATPSREVAFSPTILGAASKTTSVEPASNDEMFLGLGATSSASSSTLRRPAMIAGACVALVALVLFGSDSVTRYFQSWSSAGSLTMSSSTAATDTTPVSEAVLPAESTVKKISAKPVTSKPVVTEKSTADKTKRVEAIKSEKVDKPSKSEKTDRSSSTATAKKAAPVVKAKAAPIERTKKAPEKKSAPAASKTAPGTRPRIVKSPR